MRCTDAQKLIRKETGGLLSDAERAELELHIQVCDRCEADRDAQAILNDALAAWGPVEPQLGFEAFEERLAQRRGVRSMHWFPRFVSPSIAAAAMVVISLSLGATLGLVTTAKNETAKPTTEQVATALGLQPYDDVIQESLQTGIKADAVEGGASK